MSKSNKLKTAKRIIKVAKLSPKRAAKAIEQLSTRKVKFL